MAIKSTDVNYDRKKFSAGWDHMKECERKAADSQRAAEKKAKEPTKKK